MKFYLLRINRLVGRLILYLLIMWLPLFGFWIFMTPAQALDSPIHVHLTWQHETNTTMTVTWQTAYSDSGDLVLFDNVSRGGVPASYRFNAMGTSFTYIGASGYIHMVELVNLTPDTIYYFICGGAPAEPKGGYSAERAFLTSPSSARDIRFVAGGDSRTNEAEREVVSQAMAKFNPEFVLHTGDMVEDGWIQSQWETWFADVEAHWIGINGLTIPIMPVIGNHEGNAINYYQQFALPGNEMWYSYDWGPDIHITCLSTETTVSGEQQAWLENDLKEHANFTWKIVVSHQHVVDGSTYHNAYVDAKNAWVPIFDKYHVDIMITGHSHLYMRTVPMNLTHSETEGQTYENGTLYVIAGAWGAPLQPAADHWYNAYIESLFNFCVIDVFKNGSLHLQAKNDQGITFDEAWIIKNKSLPLPAMSVAFTSPTNFNTLPTITWTSTGIIDHYNVYGDGAFIKYLPSVTKSYQVTALSEGNHSVRVEAVDPLWKVVNTSMQINYDITEPSTTDNYDGLWHVADYSINLMANDNLVGVAATYYRINDGIIYNISGNGQPYINTEGLNNKLEYWSVDLANNEELPHTILTGIKLDKTAPIANSGTNVTIELGSSMKFNGSLSVDNIAIKNYTWSFIDITPKMFSGVNLSYIFSELRTYQVVLNVSDYAGWWNTTTVWVTVVDSSPPLAEFTFSASAVIYTLIVFNASQSTDNNIIVKYTWDFGDGNITASLSPQISHNYLKAGTYLVNLTVTDEGNNTASAFLTIEIQQAQKPFPGLLVGVLMVGGAALILVTIWGDKQGKMKKGPKGKRINAFRHLTPSKDIF